MEEISLTGATMTSDGTGNMINPGLTGGAAAAAAMVQAQPPVHNHGSGCKSGGCGSAPTPAPHVPDAAAIDKMMELPDDEVFKGVETLVRLGHYETLNPIIQALEERKGTESSKILGLFGKDGHSLLHWAAKRGASGLLSIERLSATVRKRLPLSLSPSFLSALLIYSSDFESTCCCGEAIRTAVNSCMHACVQAHTHTHTHR